jgi:large subunit ribosomal protein L4
MLTARYFSASGEPGDARELPEDLFDGVVNEAVLHQVVKAYLANQRQGTASTKTRSEVSGGGRKIWRQKGTGRARQGSIRAPHWRGGGIAFGPRPRDYNQDIPRKVKALARRSAFNARALREEIAIVERFDVEAPRTKVIIDLLRKIGSTDKKVLILTSGINTNVFLSARNLQRVSVLPFHEVSAYDLMRANEVVIEADALTTAAEATPAEHVRRDRPPDRHGEVDRSAGSARQVLLRGGA